MGMMGFEPMITNSGGWRRFSCPETTQNQTGLGHIPLI